MSKTPGVSLGAEATQRSTPLHRNSQRPRALVPYRCAQRAFQPGSAALVGRVEVEVEVEPAAKIGPVRRHEVGPYQLGQSLLGSKHDDRHDRTGRDPTAARPGPARRRAGVPGVAAGLDFGRVARLGTYIAHHDQEGLEALQQVISVIWRDKPSAQTLIGVAALALPDMLCQPDRRRTRRHDAVVKRHV
jgi:hypothetical protein